MVAQCKAGDTGAIVIFKDFQGLSALRWQILHGSRGELVQTLHVRRADPSGISARVACPRCFALSCFRG
jgi:hypothetical protein